jgi:hypothetical protein
MKSAERSARGRILMKGGPKFTDVDAYIESASPEVRDTLEEIRRVVKAAVRAAVETISYPMPAFMLSGRKGQKKGDIRDSRKGTSLIPDAPYRAAHLSCSLRDRSWPGDL